MEQVPAGKKIHRWGQNHTDNNETRRLLETTA
jgi:hypothetical protein